VIYVVATLEIRPDTLEALVDVARPLLEGTRNEPGCRRYDLHASVTDPSRVVFVEEWESREHLEAHFGTPHIAAWRQASKPFVVSARVEIIHPDRVEAI